MHVRLEFEEGHYCVTPLAHDEVASNKASGHTVVFVSNAVWAAWESLLQQKSVFEALWSALDNEATVLAMLPPRE